MATPNYHCTQQELYTILETAWNNCKREQLRFATFKAKYTIPYIDGKLLDVITTKEIPDEQARNEAAETARIHLSAAGILCLNKWQLLKRYIADAFPKELQKPKLESAGSDYYLKASQENWDSLSGLLTSAMQFINTNLAALTAADNMPPAFQTEFQTLKSDFETKHQTFLAAEETEVSGAEIKVNANNQVHAEAMKMLLDGQEIFKNEEATQKQFIFAELLYLASGTGTAGVKGHVTSAPANTPLENVKVGIPAKNKIVQTNETGFYQFLQLAAGKYTITFELEGYQTHTEIQFDIKVGTVSTLNVELTPNP